MAITPYMLLADADTYFDDFLTTSDWTSFSDANRTKALKEATRMIDNCYFLGEKYDYNQDNQFPRYLQLDIESELYDLNGVVPDVVKQACCWQALHLLRTTKTYGTIVQNHDMARRESQSKGLASAGRANVSESWTDGLGLSVSPFAALCQEARDLLNSFRANTGNIGDWR